MNNGNANTANGFSSSFSNTSGSNNTSVGYHSLYNNKTASYNTAVGFKSLSKTTGQQNTATGSNSLLNNSTGAQNTAFGYNAGDIITTGSQNVLLGYGADPSANNASNQIVIGYNAIGAGNNTVQLGNTSITNVKTSGTITAGAITIPNTDGSNGQVLATNGSGILSWATPTTVSPAAFYTTSNVTSNSNGTIATDDFVFGSTSLGDTGNASHDARMYFDKSKGAFRVGLATSVSWNNLYVGVTSFAAGEGTDASGTTSTAFGLFTKASGDISMAIGNRTIASGRGSVAMGQNSISPSFIETTIGINGTEYTPNSTTSFNATDRLFTIGNGYNSSNRSNALVILKNGNTTLKGQLTLTNGSNSYTLPNTDGAANQVLATNGSGTVSWTTASSGGSGTFDTTSGVTANSNGTIATDDFVFGSTSLNNISGSSDDARLFFDKGKSAFRAGKVTGVQWDYSNLGEYSTAMGLNNIAKGAYSTSMGTNNQSKGRYSITIGRDNITEYDDTVAIGLDNQATSHRAVAIGIRNIASSSAAIAMGSYNESSSSNSMTFGYGNIANAGTALAIGKNNFATATSAIAIGDGNKASGHTSSAIGSKVETEGNYATAFGRNTKSKSYGETAIGFYNTDYSAASINNSIATDRLFTIGNGASNASRSDALVMLKNGNTTVSGNWSGPAFTATSDIRLKEGIADLSLGMAVLNTINTKQYYLKKDATKQLRFGVIAQELREVLPNLVYGEEGENSYLSVNYTELIPILINALKAQDIKIAALENQNLILLELVKRVEVLEKK